MMIIRFIDKFVGDNNGRVGQSSEIRQTRETAGICLLEWSDISLGKNGPGVGSIKVVKNKKFQRIEWNLA